MADVLDGTFCCAICEAGPPGDEPERAQLTVVAGWMVCRFHLLGVLTRVPRGPIAVAEYIERARTRAAWSTANPPAEEPHPALAWSRRLLHVQGLHRVELGEELAEAIREGAGTPSAPPKVALTLWGKPVEVVADLPPMGWRLINRVGIAIRTGSGLGPIE